MSTLKIGIDAKWYFSGPPSGSYVVRMFVNKLIKANFNVKLYLILRAEDYGKNLEVIGQNCEIIYTKFISNNLIWNSFISQFQLSKYKLDVVLFQNFTPLFSEFKRVAFIHDVIFKSHPQFFKMRERLYFAPLKYLAKRADCIITVSNNEKNRLLKYNYNVSNKIFVIYNGVSKKFKVKEEYSISRLTEIKDKYNLPNNYILYVGRLNVRKNIETVIRSLIKINPKYDLVIGGKMNSLSFELKKLAVDLEVSRRVHFIDYVPWEDLYPIYSLSKLFLFISFEEGFGLPPIEAMKCGIPVVVSNSSCFPEICGEAGNYVDPKKPEDVAKVINELLERKDLYDHKCSQGMSRSKLFDWDVSTNRLLEILAYVSNHDKKNN